MREVGNDLIVELVVLLGFLFTLYIGEKAVLFLFQGALLFGKYPVAYLFDGADIALICCFTVRSCQRVFG